MLASFCFMYNRAEIVDNNFIKWVKEGRFPENHTPIEFSESGLSRAELIDLFESQVMSRLLDIRARELKNDNQCFYTIGSSGHEGNAAAGKVFNLYDMAFLHYRSGALMAQRAKQLPGSTPLYDNLLSFVASSEEPISGGRHKVFGSRPLLVPPQTSTIASHLPKAVGAAISIGRTKDLSVPSVMRTDSVVLCSFGDASVNHATAQAAFNTAAHVASRNISVPIVFLCEDNGIGISVPTPNNWVETNFSKRPYYDYVWCDGLNLLSAHEGAQRAVNLARTKRRPVFLHMRTVRLLGHAGSDPEWMYRSFQEIEDTEFNDPLLHSARLIREHDFLSTDEILDLYLKTKERIRAISNYVIGLPKFTRPEEVRASLTACRVSRKAPSLPSEEQRSEVFGKDFLKLSSTPQHMAKLINYGLTDILLRYKNAVVFGEDVAQKGGVYNVTEGLVKKFGVRRVFNSLLDETSILGNAIGFAHNGLLPIPEIQFLAYVHNAEDQIRGEAATLAFFSQGQFVNPMVIRVAGLAYQKGFGGHFHNDNSLAIFRDIPGLIVAVPSNGADAVKMMRTCVREAETNGRVVVFVEPIALYMTKDLHTDGDKEWCFPYPEQSEEIPVGEFATYGSGEDVLIITYGNGYYHSRQAEKELSDKLQIKSQIVDLRWIAPIHWPKLFSVAKNFKRICVVEECRKTGSLSEHIVAGLVENFGKSGLSLPKIKVVAADDCFIPLGVAAAAGLPKKPEIIAGVLELLAK